MNEKHRENESFSQSSEDLIYENVILGMQENDIDKDCRILDNPREFIRYNPARNCAEMSKKYKRILSIDDTGDCLFHSLLILIGSKMSFKELRDKLKKIKYLQYCENRRNMGIQK